MRSSYAVATCELLSRGVKYEVGTPDDTFARIGLERQKKIQYAQTQVIVNAIITVGNSIAAAVSGSSNDGGGKALSQSLDTLQELLMPEEAEKKAKQATRAKDLLAREVSKGPIKFTKMGRQGKRRARSLRKKK